MKLSFIIITRDRPKEMDDCLSSIERQYLLPFEVIVIDSSRGIQMDEILQKHSILSCKYYYNPGWGTAKSRNYGILQSSGDVDVFVDDDVVLHPSYTVEVVKYFSNNKDVYGLTGPIYDRVSILRYGLSGYEMDSLKNNDELFYRAIRNDIEAYSGLKLTPLRREKPRFPASLIRCPPLKSLILRRAYTDVIWRLKKRCSRTF